MGSMFSNLGNKAFGKNAGWMNLIDPTGVHTAPFAPKPEADEVTPVETPTPEDADEKAKAEMLKKRKIIAKSGGKTILTSQYGANTDTTTKTLLGD